MSSVCPSFLLFKQEQFFHHILDVTMSEVTYAALTRRGKMIDGLEIGFCYAKGLNALCIIKRIFWFDSIRGPFACEIVLRKSVVFFEKTESKS